MKKELISWTGGLVALAIIVFPGAVHGLIDTQLEIGDRGQEVTELQQFLAKDPSIYPEGLVTGYFGPLTRSAVIRYQARNGILQVGRVGPITAARINSGMGIGGSDDISAPIISNISVSTTSPSSGGNRSATITWNTSEDATGKVYYGTTFPFLLDSTPVILDTNFDRTKHVVLPSLVANTTYFYIVESTDIAGNIMRTVHYTLLPLPF